MRIQAPRGTKDVLPSESHRWSRLEAKFRHLSSLYGYQEIRTPTFEDTALFLRTAGETSDVVSKQMYTFTDKGDRSITLKPEETAPALRAVLEHNLYQPGSPLRLSYVTPIFRYERPQLGRLREAHQVGLELIGSPSPAADAEIIELTVRFYQELGLTDLQVSINSLGRTECRSRYREALLAYAQPYLATQSEEVRAKVDKNPLRLLDSKDPEAIAALLEAPSILDFLEPEAVTHFASVQSYLSSAGVPFAVAPEIVRGLDYYSDTVFEVQSTKLGAQGALCGGGRYDGLMADLGGTVTPSVGVGMGIERALIVLAQDDAAPGPSAYFVQASPEAEQKIIELMAGLRNVGISATRDLDARSTKAQFKQADRLGSAFAVVLGGDELSQNQATVKRLSDGSQQLVPFDELAASIREELSNT